MMRSTSVPRVKICGITNLEDAMEAVCFGADALGFVFAPSQRKIDVLKARDIIQKLPPFVASVGVFMNQSLDFVKKTAAVSGIDAVQLHGEEDANFIKDIEIPVIKRIKILDTDTVGKVKDTAARIKVAGYILDPGCGDGDQFKWLNFIELPKQYPIIIAGGLTPENVKKAVNIIKPFGVDVSSGVEKSLGIKDHEKIKKFIMEAKCSLM